MKEDAILVNAAGPRRDEVAFVRPAGQPQLQVRTRRL